MTRTLGPAPAAARLYGVHDIHFRNVHVNAESGYATCDGDDCATFLRVNKYPYENAIEDVPHGLTVREREFARLDVSGTPTPVTDAAFPKGAVVKKLPAASRRSAVVSSIPMARSISSTGSSSASTAGRRSRG